MSVSITTTSTTTTTTTTSRIVYLLTGDIGGTNSRMHLYEIGSPTPLVVKYYVNATEIKVMEDGIFEKMIISPFLQHCWEVCASTLVKVEECEIVACLACAGMICNNTVKVTNILKGIMIDGAAVEKQLYQNDLYLGRIRVCRIINDFVAQGYGCLTLQPHEVRELTPGSFGLMNPMGPKVCVGAGTGLGECYLTPDVNKQYTCFPSEGGHVEYAPRDELESKLWKYLQIKFSYRKRVSVERVVSGRGLANVYEFLAKEFESRVDRLVHEAFEQAGDLQGKIVAENAKEGTLCHQAMEIMMSSYGSEVGSAAIKFIPTGGMFVSGGLTPKNIDFIDGEETEFMKAYRDKGRVSPVLNTIPLFAVMVEDLGVRGALFLATEEYESYIAKEGNSRKIIAASMPMPTTTPEVSLPGFSSLVVTGVASFAAGLLLSQIRK